MFEIKKGLMSHQVLQRNGRGFCETTIVGTSSTGGKVQIRVRKGGRVLPGLDFKRLGTVKKGGFSIKLKGIPAGGHYDISLRLLKSDGTAEGQAEFKDVLVGDVWILAGQSNMEGIGLLKNAAKPIPLVRAFYMDDRWAVAKDPIHNLGQAVDQVHTDINGGQPCVRPSCVGTGPGVSFGQEMYRLSGIPQGLISCAHGGASMQHWDPALKKHRGRSLYGAMIRRFEKNGSNIAGVVWYQGESDAIDGQCRQYTRRMKKLVASMRRDFAKPILPFVMVQLAGYHIVETSRSDACWNAVQDQQRLLPKVIDRLAVVPAVDLGLDDCIHIDGISQQRLGRRLAEAGWMLVSKNVGKTKTPILLEAIKAVPSHRVDVGYINLEVCFKNVAGRLCSQGRPSGFTIVSSGGQVQDFIYRVDLVGSKAILKTAIPSNYRAKLRLYYGYGFSPYCNITDQADRSIPVFGPIKVRVISKR
ncbi:MAG: sialate O-acetylesterase [Planctomycetota bacterium]